MGRTSSKGFTLLELLATIAILGIVLAMGIPSLATMLEKRRTVAAVERIYSELQLARSTAVARSETVFMNIVPGVDWAVGVSNDALCDPSDNNPVCSLPDVNNNNPVTHLFTSVDNDNVSLASTANQITFLSQRGTASPTTIVVTSQGDMGFVVNIIVRPLGQISICSPTADPGTYVSSYRACA